MKKKIMAVLATIAAVLGFGFATNTAMADDYGATVTYGGTTATVTFPAGTFQPNESVTVYYDDAIVADVQQIAEVSKTFTAKADGSLTLLYTFKASQAGKTIAVKAVGAVSGTKTAPFRFRQPEPVTSPVPRLLPPPTPVRPSHRTVWPLCCLPPRASPCSPSARTPLVADVTDIINSRR